MSAIPKLFHPIKIGEMNLNHRVVLAPLTRYKATKTGHVPSVPLVKEYYEQRASMPGTLLISEAVIVAPEACGYNYVPGLWNPEHIKAWKEITDAVHAKGSFIYAQLWALGRLAYPACLAFDGCPYTAPSPIPLPLARHDVIPRELTIEEIKNFIQYFAQGARNAIEAGFDGVELHGASGYLVDQFLQDVANERTDEYGGSVENRSRFALETMSAICSAIGEERCAVRISPFSPFQGMGMANPEPQFAHFVTKLKEQHPRLAYLHVVEPHIDGSTVLPHDINDTSSNDFLRKIWKPLPYIAAGGYERDTAFERAEEDGDLIAFGKHYLANPDLPLRLMRNIPLNPYDEPTFYIMLDAEGTEKGYNDYPFANLNPAVPESVVPTRVHDVAVQA